MTFATELWREIQIRPWRHFKGDRRHVIFAPNLKAMGWWCDVTRIVMRIPRQQVAMYWWCKSFVTVSRLLIITQGAMTTFWKEFLTRNAMEILSIFLQPTTGVADKGKSNNKQYFSSWRNYLKGKWSDWIRLIFAHPFPLNSGAPNCFCKLH